MYVHECKTSMISSKTNFINVIKTVVDVSLTYTVSFSA